MVRPSPVHDCCQALANQRPTGALHQALVGQGLPGWHPASRWPGHIPLCAWHRGDVLRGRRGLEVPERHAPGWQGVRATLQAHMRTLLETGNSVLPRGTCMYLLYYFQGGCNMWVPDSMRQAGMLGAADLCRLAVA